MEFEKVPTCSTIFVKKSSETYYPMYQKITFEIPSDISEGFLSLCDKHKLDPDEIVSKLLKKYLAKKTKGDSRN